MFGTKQTPDLKKLWEENKEFFLKQMHLDQAKYPDKKGMIHAFIDSKGQSYYRIQSGTLAPPFERVAKAQDYLVMMSRGLDDSEIDMLIEAAHSELALAFANKPNKAPIVVGSVFKAMQERKNMLLHIDLYYEYFALWVIREDEEVGSFNQEIHDQKVKQFKEDNRGKNSFFFFQIPELKAVNELLKSSESEWMQQCEESQKKIDNLKNWARSLSTGAKKSAALKQTETST
jgi:hypothetical protein